MEDDCTDGFIKANEIAARNPLAYNLVYKNRVPAP